MNTYFKTQNHYHITCKINLSEWPEMPMDIIWCAFNNHLSVLKHNYNLTPKAFVLMNNHFHILCSSPNKCIQQEIEVLQDAFISTFSLVGYWDELFENTFQVKKVDNISQYRETYKYICRNPVDAGLVIKAEEYPYCSIQNLIHREEYMCTIEDDMHLYLNPNHVLNWINNKNPYFYMMH